MVIAVLIAVNYFRSEPARDENKHPDPVSSPQTNHETTTPVHNGTDPLLHKNTSSVRKETNPPAEHYVAGPKINMDHILHGGINRRGDLVGMHHLPSAPKDILVEGKRCKVDIEQTSQGGPDDVVQARVRLLDPQSGKVVREKFSSLYPSAWTEQDIVAAIREAYADAEKKQTVDVEEHKFDGHTRLGIKISGYLLPNGEINTAFPVYSAPHKNSSSGGSNPGGGSTPRTGTHNPPKSGSNSESDR